MTHGSTIAEISKELRVILADYLESKEGSSEHTDYELFMWVGTWLRDNARYPIKSKEVSDIINLLNELSLSRSDYATYVLIMEVLEDLIENPASVRNAAEVMNRELLKLLVNMMAKERWDNLKKARLQDPSRE